MSDARACLPRRHAAPASVGALAAVLLAGLPARAAAAPAGQYETGFADLVRIAADLHQALPPEQRPRFQPVPVLRDGVAEPWIRPGLRTDGPNPLCAVEVSAGFVALLNYLSHAKAIDGVDRGFYKKSITSLAVRPGETGFPPLDLSHPKAWAFDTLNHQVSHFNQMAGALLAIQMAHHYLGHYQKYAGRLTDGQDRPVPFASLLTADEWQEAVLKGANHALKCALGVDGLKHLFEGLQKMPTRPDWAAHLLPPTANLARINRALGRTEHDFFLVSDFAR